MNKTSIKVIKRKDADIITNDKIQDLSESKAAVSISEEKLERRLHRKMADTISNWIFERPENSRIKNISAIRKLFGDESLLSKTA